MYIMKVTGIVCEYNPMHSGHVYHIDKAKQNGATHIVCAMSGNYVQRGEPAIIDKWSRAKVAVENGADLVFEIPTPWCLESAAGYAGAGVTILANAGCNALSCGSETDDTDLINQISNLFDNRAFIDELVNLTSKGISYPSAITKLAESHLGSKAVSFLENPNNVLALEYLKSIKRNDYPILFEPVKRQGNHYNSTSVSGSFLSASAIRNADCDVDLSFFADEMTTEIQLKKTAGKFPAKIQTAERTILSALSVMTKDELINCCGEDFGNRIKKAVDVSSTYNELIDNIKNKSLTLASVRRMVLRAYLKIPFETTKHRVPYLKLLAIGKNGREILAKIKSESDIPIVSSYSDFTNLDSFAKSVYELECNSTNLYGSFTPKFCYQNTEMTTKLYVG